MPVNDFESPFEQIVLTQAAIRVTNMLRDWFSRKEKAQQEPDAVNRSRKLAALDPDQGNSREEVAQHLSEAFKEAHASIFKYASRYNKRRENRVFQVDQLLPEYRANIKHIFDGFVAECYEADGSRKAMDTNEAAAAMQRLYENLKNASEEDAPAKVPLRYKRFPASFILTQLGQGEKWKDINHGQGIDFNRGRKPEAGEDLGERFRKAFDGGQDAAREREFKTSEFIPHNESHVDIAGYRFPCVRFGWGQTHVLTDTGYFVDLNDNMVKELKDRLRQEKGGRADSCLIDFTPPQENGDPASRHLSDSINTGFNPAMQTDTQKEWAQRARESLDGLKKNLSRIKTADKVDGRDAKGGKAMLVSMDIDLLTGLSLKDTKAASGAVRKSEVSRLCAFISAHAREIRPDMPQDLATMSDFLAIFPKTPDAEKAVGRMFDKLHAIAEKERNADIMELIDAAKPHVQAIVPRVMQAVSEHFFHKDTHEPIRTQEQLLAGAHTDEERRRHGKPRYFMTIGGIAAGKSGAEILANEECGKDNYIIAGLDHVRSMFDRQAINLATDNHNYDYKNIEQAGKLVRALVLEHAREKGYHVLLDGSGIPYEGRYAEIVDGFKHNAAHAYDTSVLAFDRTLYVNNPALREELSRQMKAPKDALLQQGIRAGRELRAVPVKIIANNYAAVPEAVLQASQDLNVDRFWLVDTNPKKAKDAGNGATSDSDIHPYILSFTAEVTPDQLDQLDRLKGRELLQAIAAMQDNRDHAPPNRKIAAALNHPIFRPDSTNPVSWDFKVVNKTPRGNYRIEVITDSQRYLSTMEKGLFNREANGPEELYKLTRLMGFDVEGLFESRGGMLKVQPDKEVGVDEWPQIPFATGHSLAARGEKCLRIPDHEAVTFQTVQPSYAGSAKA